jgi:hypothetical protein
MPTTIYLTYRVGDNRVTELPGFDGLGWGSDIFDFDGNACKVMYRLR